MGLAVGHLVMFAVTVVLSMYSVYHLVYALLEHGFSGATIGGFLGERYLAVAGTLAGIAVLNWLGRARGPVEFDERHAVDVESMGLYWHFVDIVWIVIFTAVYLLEYVFPVVSSH